MIIECGHVWIIMIGITERSEYPRCSTRITTGCYVAGTGEADNEAHLCAGVRTERRGRCFSDNPPRLALHNGKDLALVLEMCPVSTKAL